jgi:hypothetical protein
MYLLLNSSIFLPCTRGCYFQVTGESLAGYSSNSKYATHCQGLFKLDAKNATFTETNSLKRKNVQDNSVNGRKKIKLKCETHEGKKNLTVPWSQYLYGKPVYSETGRIVCSLPINRNFFKLMRFFI